MYKRLLVILITGFVNLTGVFPQTGPVEVTRSENRIVIEGRVYYIHLVKPGQTLYSISRVYNVPQKDLLLENPNLYAGLQAGQALKIPYMPEVVEADDTSADSDGEYIYHTVEPGQTLFFLSRNYEVPIDEITRLNPGVEDVLSIGQVVRIPAKRVYITREGFPTEDDRYIHHKVEKGETLYSLSRHYNVTVRSIRRANDRLIWGLRYGEFIRIPKDPGDYEDEPADVLYSDIDAPELPSFPDTEPPDAGIFDAGVILDAECAGFNYNEYNKPFNVALLLPLYVERNYPVQLPDTVDARKAAELFPGFVTSVNELYHETIPFLEFLEGALLALDSLVNEGVSVNLSVYDTERRTEKVRQIIREPSFRDHDLIIGPVYPENLKIVADWAQSHQINIVTPLASISELLEGNQYLFQVTPSATAELEQASLFISNFPSSNFVLIHNNDPFEGHLVNGFKTKMFRHFSYSSDFDNMVFKEILYTDATVNIEQSLVPGEKNIVIIPSVNQAFVSNVLMRLNILSRLYDITIFGLSDWQRFPNIEVEYLHNLELHFASPFFVDYENENVKRFLRSFRDKYKTEPGRYSFQGYDIMFYFLRAMKSYGPDFRECLPIIRTGLLQSDFLFRKSDYRNGFENNGISIVRYEKDMNITRLGLNGRYR
jgi:LysM repeat protein